MSAHLPSRCPVEPAHAVTAAPIVGTVMLAAMSPAVPMVAAVVSGGRGVGNRQCQQGEQAGEN